MLMLVALLWLLLVKGGINEWLGGALSVTAVALLAQCLAWLVGGHL
jgi:hypothetical protein